MNPIQTGIAVALALVVVGGLFFFPGLSPLRSGAPTEVATSTPIDITKTDTSSGTQTSANGATQTMNEPTPTNSNELQGTDLVVGTGAVAAAGDTVTVNYVGTFPDGKVFDASSRHFDNGFTFNLGTGSVIQGWDMGVVGMKEGGKRKLIIPPSLGYGAAGAGDTIPPNATLVFEIELLKVQKR